MTLEILRWFLLVALAALAFQGGSAREAFAKRAEYDAALERAYEWSKQTHAAEERVMGGLALEARDLLRHPPEVATPPAPGRPDAAAVARSSSEPHRPTLARADVETPQSAPFKPGLGSRLWAWFTEQPISERESDETEEPATERETPSPAARLLAWLDEKPAEEEASEEIEAATNEGEATWPGSRLWAWLAEIRIRDQESDASGETEAEQPTPSRVSRLWAWFTERPISDQDSDETEEPPTERETPSSVARLLAWLDEKPAEEEASEEIEAATNEGEATWPGSRLWAWLAEIRIRDQESDASEETEAEQPTPSRVARLRAWLSQPSQELEPGEDGDLEAEEETARPGASPLARLAALFGGSDAPRAAGPTQVAVAEVRREPVPNVSSSAKLTPERSIGDELGERTPARDPSAEGAATKIRTKTVRVARPAAPTPTARADPTEPPPRPATAVKRVVAAQPAEASAPRQDAPPLPNLRPTASQSGTPGPSPLRAEPARAAKRSVPARGVPTRPAKVKSTPPTLQATRGRAASEAKHRPGLATRTERAEEPTEPLPQRSRPTGAPSVAKRAAPPTVPPSNSRTTAAEAPRRVSSHRAARGERVARAEPRPREEPLPQKPRSAVRRPPRPEFQEALPGPAEPWRARGRALARQELARVQAALQRDGRSAREIDPLRVAIDILRAEQQQALARISHQHPTAADRR